MTSSRKQPSHSDLHEAISSRLASVGQRYTGGRREIVDALASSGRPLSMGDILERTTGIPQSSAYRHLTVLVSCGVVHRISATDDFGYFELTDELSGNHHHHVMCSNCGKVVDIASSAALENALNEAVKLASKKTGYEIDAHRIDLVGTCSDCRYS